MRTLGVQGALRVPERHRQPELINIAEKQVIACKDARSCGRVDHEECGGVDSVVRNRPTDIE